MLVLQGIIRFVWLNSVPDFGSSPSKFFNIRLVNQLSNSASADFSTVKLGRAAHWAPLFSLIIPAEVRQQVSCASKSWRETFAHIDMATIGCNYDLHLPSYVVPNDSLRCSSFHISYLRQLNSRHSIRICREMFVVWPHSHIYLIGPYTSLVVEWGSLIIRWSIAITGASYAVSGMLSSQPYSSSLIVLPFAHYWLADSFYKL